MERHTDWRAPRGGQQSASLEGGGVGRLGAATTVSAGGFTGGRCGLVERRVITAAAVCRVVRYQANTMQLMTKSDFI